MAAAAFASQGIDRAVFRVADPARAETLHRAASGGEMARQRGGLGALRPRDGAWAIGLAAIDGRPGQHGGAAASPGGRHRAHLRPRIEPANDLTIHARATRAAHGIAHAALSPATTAHRADGPSPYDGIDGDALEPKRAST
ncbi:hypothetical protein EBB59_12790 [Lysobacter pythonis]|uniref:Uncharacterized protein n=1 Tax=Solilutibacter pythonis TaxID=2483112 RepID=A0A3M2HF85_9GAMM|nr:hypothetical protein [Lysobacter pythonis]RMH87608.1 hypothetical protein EBB59_12790 [Lysobacter pythonis]